MRGESQAALKLELEEMAKEKIFQEKLLEQIREDDKIDREDPVFQKLEKLESQNYYLDAKVKAEGKMLRLSETALKKICLVNAKLDMNQITQSELENFRTSNIF